MFDPDKLLRWYAGLHSRTLDLVSDYAGDELFIIEGDSLLLHCFSNDKLDLHPGFQILHAAYIVETFVKKLQQRKCNFHVVFFDNHATTCIPPNASGISRQRYLLAREAILHHLLENIPSATSSIQVKTFECYDCPGFSNYISSLGVYFFMCHDGAFANLCSSGGMQSDYSEREFSDDIAGRDYTSSGVLSTSVVLRTMIYWFICNGYNIALIDTVEFRDTKAMVAVIEGSVQMARSSFKSKAKKAIPAGSLLFLGADLDEDSEHDSTEASKDKTVTISQSSTGLMKTTIGGDLADLVQEMIQKASSEGACSLTQRELLLVLTVSCILKRSSSDGDKIAARAMLLHCIIQRESKLCERVCMPTDNYEGQTFLGKFIDIATVFLKSSTWTDFQETKSCHCDLADMMDGNLFLEVLERLLQRNFQKPVDPYIFAYYGTLASIVKSLCGIEMDLEYLGGPNNLTVCQHVRASRGIGFTALATDMTQVNAFSVLPFSNSVLDTHLSPVQLSIADSPDDNSSQSSSKIFEEISHWHNHRRPLNAKVNFCIDDRQAFWANRRNQWFMAEMREYAASLTNSTGGILEPEPVLVRSGKDSTHNLNRPSGKNKTLRPKIGPSSNHQGRKHNSKADALPVREKAASSILTRHNEAIKRHIKIWKTMVLSFERESNHSLRYIKVKAYHVGLPSDKRDPMDAEIVAYLVNTLFRLWMERCRQHKRDTALSIVALMWSHILHVTEAKTGVSDGIQSYLCGIVKLLHLPSIDIPCHEKRCLSFEPITSIRGANTSIAVSPLEFQLVHAGPYFDRSVGSSPDPRVHDFEPDQWQRDVLDQIDSRKSLFVVAPTSAGKTFISFYAMKQVLEDDDSGILVYVAPTKALVNQIAAEVQARFSKSFKYSNGKSVWAIHTRDYRVNNPTGCQILVTVPHILQIMLLSPSNAKSWSSQVRRIIFDEIHCIGQAEDGVVWEQLLLLAPCPIIALSATVGNPQEFNEWLQLTQGANGNELNMIEHRTRYSDLRKYIYQPPEKFVFNGLPGTLEIPHLGLDSSPNMRFLHPVAGLIDRARGMPDDFTLEPRDCWTLWHAMDKHKTAEFPLDDSLNPSTILPSVIRKVDIVKWEAKLKAILSCWIKDPNSPFDAVFKDLSGNTQGPASKLQVSSQESISLHSEREVRKSSLLSTTLPLICSLHEQGALPALIFNYDRSWCERICHGLLNELKEAERQWKDSSSVWQKKVAGWQAWLKVEEKKGKSRSHGKKADGQGDGDTRMSKAENLREAASAESSCYKSFDPEQPVPNFLLADEKKLSPSEFNEHVIALRQRFVPEWLIEALKRGIGVHHAGMNRKYRQVCEMLFRKGYLRVVIATGTLALGINMPCKTVVFAGDSVFLTALSFRQAAGRAGRRGFDFLGNVVFQGVPHSKVCRLLSSKLPDLNGHFPITTSLVLRLLILLHESGQSPFAVKAVNSLLSCPRIYLGGPESNHTVLHHLRFSIEYLRRNHLLDKRGAPLNFAGTVSHLYYTESSSFAFHSLLSGGYFHDMCRDIETRPKAVLKTLMLVLSHIFGRHHLRPSYLESSSQKIKESPSLVVLPPLPEEAASVLHAHNTSTLDIYAAYVTTFIQQHIHEPDCTLPLTGLKCGGSKPINAIAPALSCLPPTQVTSAFVALSGHSDKWNSISELCEMVRGGVWLEQAVVPYVTVQPENKTPLNAYLYDFFRHGNVHALEKGNMVRKGDIWFVLNDFSLVLATIVTSLENFLKLSPGVDDNLLDVMGGGDAHEDGLDDVAAAVGDSNPSEPSRAGLSQLMSVTQVNEPRVTNKLTKAKKEAVADSWEDEVSDDGSTLDESTQSRLQYEHEARRDQNAYDEIWDTDSDSSESVSDGQGILLVLQAFRMLQAEFNEKFKAMWA